MNQLKFKPLILVFTILLCAGSFMLVLKTATALGYDLAHLRDPATALHWSTMLLILTLHIIPIALIFIAQRFVIKQPLKSLNPNKKFWRFISFGFLFGVILKSISTLGSLALSENVEINFTLKEINLFTWLPYYVWYLFALSLNSFNEELIYRSFPLSNLHKNSYVKLLLAIFSSALLFSVVHFLLEEPSLLRFFYRLAFGILTGLLFVKHQSLWLIVALHNGWNFIAISFAETSWQEGGILNIHQSQNEYEIFFNVIVLSLASIVIFRTQRTTKGNQVPLRN